MITRSITEIKKALAKKEISATELTRSCLEHIDKTDEKLGAFINIYPEQALQKAKELDEKGFDETMPLWGIPVSVKDALATKNMKTTAGSKILENFIPPYSAFAVGQKQYGRIRHGKHLRKFRI